MDPAGRTWGVIEVEEIFQRDPLEESRAVYGTEDAAHPGVAYLLERPRTLVAGPVTVLPLPEDLPFASYRLTPRALRARIAERGWRHVAGFQTRNPIHRAHEHLTKLALEMADGLVIHPLVGETKDDDVPAAVRFQAYEVLLEKYYPRERTLLAAFPAAMRYAGPREALFHALVRKNYGIDRLIVGRDHAGVGRFYGPLDAQRIFDRFTAEELGVAPLQAGADVLLPRLRRARVDPHLRARPRAPASSCPARACARSCARAAACRRSSRGPRSRASCAPTTAARRAPAPARPARVRRLHRVVHGAVGRRQEHARGSAAPGAAARCGRSRCWTATRCARTCRRAWASRARTATPTSTASATSRACSRATAWP